MALTLKPKTKLCESCHEPFEPWQPYQALCSVFCAINYSGEQKATQKPSTAMNTYQIPIKLVSVANLREHWAKRAKRAKEHRRAGLLLVKEHPLPCVVTITRVGGRSMDSDNLSSACKALRDGVAQRLGVDDGSPLVTWRYEQRKSLMYFAEVRIEPV